MAVETMGRPVVCGACGGGWLHIQSARVIVGERECWRERESAGVIVGESERERERKRERESAGVIVGEREREREKERERERALDKHRHHVHAPKPKTVMTCSYLVCLVMGDCCHFTTYDT
jgi:hypothetical protein